MYELMRLLENPMMEAFGWPLLHFFWQKTFIALLASTILLAMKNASAQTRYIAPCGVLGAMVACPVITWFWVAMGIDPGKVEKVALEHIGSHAELSLNGLTGTESSVDRTGIDINDPNSRRASHCEKLSISCHRFSANGPE